MSVSDRKRADCFLLNYLPSDFIFLGTVFAGRVHVCAWAHVCVFVCLYGEGEQGVLFKSEC